MYPTQWTDVIMWQSQVEIQHYSVVYFNCITAFEVLYHRTSIKSGADMRCVNVVSIHEFTQSPSLNGSSTLEHFKRSNAIEIRNGIMFDFYPGLPHMAYKTQYRLIYAAHESILSAVNLITWS